jgi:hypothetical protein
MAKKPPKTYFDTIEVEVTYVYWTEKKIYFPASNSLNHKRLKIWQGKGKKCFPFELLDSCKGTTHEGKQKRVYTIRCREHHVRSYAW